MPFTMPSNMPLSPSTVSGINGPTATMSADGTLMMMGPNSQNTTV